MKRKTTMLATLCCITSIITLTGCEQNNSFVSRMLQKRLTEQSKKSIHATSEYKKYKEYQDKGYLDENGEYIIPMPVEGDLFDKRAVQVTIAENSFLNCIFYTDSETKTPIVGTQIALRPGESLYVDEIYVNNPSSNHYDFSCFRIWSYDKDGNKSKAPYKEVSIRNGLLLEIPQNYKGAGFSIEPLGEYTNRSISVKTFYRDGEQERTLGRGIWKINKKPFYSKNTEISPIDSYTLEYDYRDYKDNFYFVSSTPACWYSTEDTVIFKEASANDEYETFSVEMHPYITLKITNSCINWTSSFPVIGDNGTGIIQSIFIEGQAAKPDSFGQKTFDVSKRLKVGDTISMVVGKAYKITGTPVNVGTAIPLGNNAENGYEYTFVVPDGTEELSIDISERNSNAKGIFQGYNLANAEVIVFRENGSTLKKGDELPGDDEKVSIKIIPNENDNYYISGYNADNYSFKSDPVTFSKLEKDISSMLKNHPAVHFLTLKLKFSDEAGEYSYSLDGKKVTDSVLSDVRVGQNLKVDFTACDDYKISHSWFGANAAYGIWDWLGGDDSISESIKITAGMDGETIDKDTFGIVVKR